MHVRGNKPAGMAARVIMALIAVVGVATVAIAIYAMRSDPLPKRGSQALPGQVAERLGRGKTPAVSPK